MPDFCSKVFNLKKLATIFLFTVYLFSTTEAHQLLKLPVIFQHFLEHKSENKQISFLQFLDIHYMHGNPNDKDHDRDMQLPFKTSGCCAFSVSTSFVSLMQPISIENPSETMIIRHGISKIHFINSSYLSNIWQPPKTC